jgi:hypothetical protein
MLNVLQIPPAELFSLLVAIGFAAGLNTYATVAVLGLLAHFAHLPLPPGLQLLAGWPVIIASLALFGIEFFADKIPAFDLIWNALHTFIRIPAAALMAYAASSHLSPAQQLLVTCAGAGIAAIAHSSKTAARIAVTPSPEPVSNIGLSSAEDAVAIGLTWIAMHYPRAAGIAVAALSLALVAALWWGFARIRAALRRLLRDPSEA